MPESLTLSHSLHPSCSIYPKIEFRAISQHHAKQPQLLLNEPLRIWIIDNILNYMLRARPEREHIHMRKTAYANFFIQLLGLREIWMLLPSILRITNLTLARTFEAFIKRWIDAHQ